MRVETKPFAAAIAEAAKLIDFKSTIPILHCVGISAGYGSTVVFATDSDAELERTLPADGRLEPVAINCRDLASILKGAAKGSFLTFEMIDSPVAERPAVPGDEHNEPVPAVKAKDGRIAITSDCGGVDARMTCHAGGDMPRMRARAESGSALVSGHGFRNGLTAVNMAISSEESRYYLNGIYLHARNYRGAMRLCMATTDGCRLAFKALAVDAPEAMECPSVIVPRRAVGVLARNLPADDVRMVWHAGDVHTNAPAEYTPAPAEYTPAPVRFTFYAEGVTVTTRLIDGTFPDYQRVIPTGNDKRATFDRLALLKACKDAMRALGSPKVGGRSLKLTLAHGETIIEAVHAETRAAFRRKVPSKLDVNGKGPFESFAIGFNAQYLADHCETVDGDEIELALADAGGPALVRDLTDPDWLGVLMPMRV